MSWRSYDRPRALAYDAERAAPDEHVAEVRDLLVHHVAGLTGAWLVDIGAGTGVWSSRLARWSSKSVLAVEPSSAMLAVLAEKRPTDVVAVQGRAEALPVRDSACSVAWLSTVVHHFSDLELAAAETARVLAPRGMAIVRSSFPDQASGQGLHTARLFPSARTVIAAFPTLDEVTAAFAQAGLALLARHTPREVASPTRRDFYERLQRRADSLLSGVTHDELAAGLQRARDWVQVAPEAPVLFRPDLLIFG